jgi:hypothetical protein
MVTKKTPAKRKVKARKVEAHAGAQALVGHDETEKRQNADANVKIGEVIATLEAMGYDPVKKLVEARNGHNLNEFQKVAIDKELMKYVHAQKKAVDLTAQVDGTITVQVSEVEDDL